MNMIASVLHLDRAAVTALRITDTYSLHRVVYSLFEDVREPEQKNASQASGILYADQGGDYSDRQILMLSDRRPAQCVDGKFGTVQSKEISADFLTHDYYRFKVIVNPTRRDNASRKLVPVKGRELIGQWFIDRALASWGFNVSPEHLQIDRVEVQRFKEKNQNQVTLAQAHVQGLLTVANRDQFINSFCHGIGRARTFGCGLLQIVPLTHIHSA